MDCGLPNPETRKNFLVLVKDDASEAAIAHEIAHAYLKHPARTNISVEQATKFEEEAKALSSKWLKKPNFHRNKFPIQISHDVQESNFGLRFIGGAAILMFIWY